MTGAGTEGASRRPFVLSVVGGWVIIALLMLYDAAGRFATRGSGDPDDAMRLAQVRDWLAGQGWFDVAQHRLGGGDFAMHWSRLVDLPIAGAILLLRPVLGGDAAELAALVIVPLLTLFVVVLLTALLVRRLAGAPAVPFAIVLLAFCLPLQFQLRPFRIDHHGWQVACALAAVVPLLGRSSARNGMLAGAALATLLTVSLEGLPIAAAVVGVAALAWALRGERGALLVALAWSFVGAATLLHLITRGPFALAPACDAIAPAWLAIFAVAAAALTLAVRCARDHAAARLAWLAAGGVATAMVALLVARDCLAGPFSFLPPRAYRHWYLLVNEGRPVWEQEAPVVIATLAMLPIGAAGTALGWLRSHGAARDRWSMLALLFLAATIVALLVVRAGATANALALPGGAVLLQHVLHRARSVKSLLPRVAATAAVVLLVIPAQIGLLLYVMAGGGKEEPKPACTAPDVAALANLPPATIFAPLDVTPEILVRTPHRAIAGGYHRNGRWIDRVIATYTAPPARAYALLRASHADYVLLCPGMEESKLYRHLAPGGLAARLQRGGHLPFLRPVPLASPLKLWRVVTPAPPPRPAAAR